MPIDKHLPTQHIRSVPEYLPVEQSGYDVDPFEQEGEIQLEEYFRVLFKFRYIIAAATGVCLLLALVYAFTATPLYVAQSKIRISSYEPVLTATKIEDVLQQKSKEAHYLETQIEEIKSLSLADKVLKDPTVEKAFLDGRKMERSFFQRLLFGEKEEELELPPSMTEIAGYEHSIQELKDYLDRISVKPVRRTSLVVIEATLDDPNTAALLANRHALAYIDWVRESRVRQQSRGLDFLKTQSQELREKVADLERELADYAEANSIVAINKDENITAQRLSQLNRMLTDATAKRIEAEHLFREAERSLSTRSAGFDDPSTQNVRAELARLEAEYSQLSQKFTANYPKMKQLRSQIEQLKKSVRDERAQIVEGLKAKAAAAKQEEQKLIEELEQQKSKAFELSKSQVEFNVLNRELTSSRELLQNVLRQIKETSLAVESNSSNVQIVDYAMVPKTASFPRKKLIVLIGLVVGLGIGLAVAFLLNYLDNTVRTPDEVSKLLRLPNLGVVPSFESERLLTAGGSTNGVGKKTAPPEEKGEKEQDSQLPVEQESNLPVAYINDPKSLAAEAYRIIRTGLLLCRAGEPPRTVLVTSAQSSEGKTTSTINLAASLASSGGRVALVDADLRRPSMYKRFHLETNHPGLVEVITGQRPLEECLRRNIIKRISFLPSGQIPPNPAELLGSVEMTGVLDRLAKEYDYVLVDSPPILPVTDSVVLSRFVDGVILVVKGGNTPRKVIRDAKARLESVGASFLGTILNDVDVTGGDYRYYHRYYYSYYQEGDDRKASSA